MVKNPDDLVSSPYLGVITVFVRNTQICLEGCKRSGDPEERDISAICPFPHANQALSLTVYAHRTPLVTFLLAQSAAKTSFKTSFMTVRSRHDRSCKTRTCSVPWFSSQKICGWRRKRSKSTPLWSVLVAANVIDLATSVLETLYKIFSLSLPRHSVVRHQHIYHKVH